MTEPDDVEEDLFADLYDADEAAAPSHAPPPSAAAPAPLDTVANKAKDEPGYGEEPDLAYDPSSFDMDVTGQDDQTNGNNHMRSEPEVPERPTHTESSGLNMKEDGKMFIGGLNWETTDQSLHDYFSQFGEVHECTVMRDSATGRSRGFGFLTFKDPKTVNTVMVKEHFLDGKIVRPFMFDPPRARKENGPLTSRARRKGKGKGLHSGFQIDPKRAIPRDEQEKTAKIFVGGVSQEASEEDFESFFAQFGRVVDATLMMDKDTGRPRGFGFVTFDSDAAVEKCLEYQPLEILGKMIEVKRAQPRGKMGEEDDFNRGGRGRGKFNRDDRFGNDNNNNNNQVGQGNQNQGQNMMGSNGMSPQMMAQYWQRMQQYFAMMQQQMASNMMGGMGGMGGMGQMTPQMMMQMQQMQKMQGGNSPNPQGGMGNMQGMNPQMMQQMMQMQQQQSGMNAMNNMGGGRGSMGQGQTNNRGSFSAQEQMAFEQQKYEHQQQTRRQGSFPAGPRSGGFQNQNPQSWEGMYDDVPQPDGGHAGPVRNNTPKPPKGPAAQASAAPANAPTGPKNPGKPTGGFRGGRGRFHPYGR
ncbi:hypothetical protein LTR84_012372 [Exophiala bonariae]|uniref:RRM domain-containing protein n=1 Tax=Exophiala bonariae TaxID=1690606 RepID=A0AAV9NIK0_9EURO|nr:hypothetical protein LTR84_012372 [Exophiala bonariae]